MNRDPQEDGFGPEAAHEPQPAPPVRVEPLLDAAEKLLGRPRTLRRREVTEAAGVPLANARRFWHALGFPAVGDEAPMFTEGDVQALRHMVGLVNAGPLDEGMALSMTRAIARTADRLAAWQSSLVLDMVMQQRDPQVSDLEPVADIVASLEAEDGSVPPTPLHHVADEASARQASELLLAVVDQLEPLVIYAWRRHLSAAIGGLVARAGAEEGEGQRTVGFADMVDFTTLVTRLSDPQLAHLVGRFEALAADVITAHGGRLVKTIGDEVFFATDRVAPAAAIALDLVEALAEDKGMPQLRIGMATGQVVSHLGDVFGTTVNRASRLTQVARPDTVVVDDAMAAALSNVTGFTVHPLRSRPLRGLGMTGLWSLERAAGARHEQGAVPRVLTREPRSGTE
ncbi:adenylate/guanylate cyclase domain-containing protein [Gephyromycinifex aptenodytis]|uniref:adenylate/guanylate cyclase domain-containing protein n=1 Tax=Gephyromycinifex aptenodytis TaxID=2716227 RepID=UPI00144620BF|nr:adenylate/guanylate cyclase domain-containing protein [Gephyromycinifex aptenodytis]